jgi:acyl carrier protein
MERILEILSGLHDEFDYRNSEDFILDGMLDSFDIVELVTEMEARFGIEIDASDIIPENFSSLERMAALVIKSGGSYD